MEPIDYLNSLFSGASQIESFQTQREMFPTARMSASPNPRPFPKGAPMALPATYTYGGTSKDLQGFLNETETMALVVLKEGTIRHENYADWGGPDTLGAHQAKLPLRRERRLPSVLWFRHRVG